MRIVVVAAAAATAAASLELRRFRVNRRVPGRGLGRMPGRAPYPRKDSVYRQNYPPFEFSVEEGTPLVPLDGRST